MGVEKDKPAEQFDPSTPEGRKKARQIFKEEIERNGFPAHRVIKITDVFYSLLKGAKEHQMEFLVGIAFAMFNNAKAEWVHKRALKSGIIVPDNKIIKPGQGG